MVKPSFNRGGSTDDLGELLGNAGQTSFVVYQLPLFDQATAVIRCGFHRDHSRGLVTGPVFADALITLSFPITARQGIQQRRRLGFVPVIP